MNVISVLSPLKVGDTGDATVVGTNSLSPKAPESGSHRDSIAEERRCSANTLGEWRLKTVAEDSFHPELLPEDAAAHPGSSLGL